MLCLVYNVLKEAGVNMVFIIETYSRESPEISEEWSAASFIKLHS